MKWECTYLWGNTYKTKYVIADSAEQAIKRARVKLIDLQIVKEE